jgi:hypothetical protein
MGKQWILSPMFTELNISEAMAMLRAVILCHELGFSSVILEGDALQIVQAIRKDGRCWSQYLHLIKEAGGVLSCLHIWKVNHVRRHLNDTANRLAKEAIFLSMEQGLVEKVLYCISYIIFVERCVESCFAIYKIARFLFFKKINK